MGDLFRLQDDIARRVSDALAVPLSGGTASPTPDKPHDARAYELFSARMSSLALTRGFRQRGSCISAASTWIRGSLPRGLTSAAAIA
jgi:hypothetical protein